MTEARRWAAMNLECSPMSIRATKQAALRSLDVPALETAMNNMNYPAYAAMARGTMPSTATATALQRSTRALTQGVT